MDNMKPADGKLKKALTLSAVDTARVMLRYALVDVDFQYALLTETERALVTQDEFDRMVKQFRLR